jgi:hypothetical protein
MSTPSATVVTPSGETAQATAMKGGAVALSPLPVSGGRKPITQDDQEDEEDAQDPQEAQGW